MAFLRPLFSLLIIVTVFAFPGTSFGMSKAMDQLVIQTQDGRKIPYQIELALTPKEHAKGLMFREELPPNHGMLFVFNQTGIKSFWMKNTLIPLDMLFIDQFGVIKHIHHNAIPHDETHISSQLPVKSVFEINGGQAKEIGIEIGDKVIHKLFLAEDDIIVY